MKNLIELFEELNGDFQSLQISILWDKIGDWQIEIYHKNSDTMIFYKNYPILEIVASEAYLALYNWKLESEA